MYFFLIIEKSPHTFHVDVCNFLLRIDFYSLSNYDIIRPDGYHGTSPKQDQLRTLNYLQPEPLKFLDFDSTS